MGKIHYYWGKISKAFVVACTVSLLISSDALAGIVDSGELTEASFWILNNNAGDSVLLDEEGIKQFNRRICDAPLDVTEMKSIPEAVDYPLKRHLSRPLLPKYRQLRHRVLLRNQ